MKTNKMAVLSLILALCICMVSCSQRKGAAPEKGTKDEGKNDKGYIIYINIDSPEKTVLYRADAGGKKKEKIYDKNPYSASAYGEKIAFMSKNSNKQILYMMNSDGKGLMPVMNNAPVRNNSISWSPDGRRIAMVMRLPSDKSDEIYYVEAGENRTPVKVTDDTNIDESPRFSSDSKMILYAKYKENNYDIVRYDVGSRSSAVVSGGSANDISPVVSPDGIRIFFLSDEKEKGKYNLYSMDMDGGNKTQVTTGLNIVKDSIRISPDNSMVAFTTVDERKNKTVQVISMNKSTIMISDDAYLSAWSSDSKKLYYATFDPNNRRIVEYDITENSMKDVLKLEYKPGQETEGIKFLHFTDK